MNRSVKIGLLVALAMMAVGTYRYVSAQGTDTLATKHALLATIITRTDGGVNVPASMFTAVDAPQTVNCPGTTPCTIQSDEWVTTSGTTSGNYVATCMFVDGVEPGDCVTTGITPNGGGIPIVASTSKIWGVRLTGTHTVQTMIFSKFGCLLGYSSSSYHVYKP